MTGSGDINEGEDEEGGYLEWTSSAIQDSDDTTTGDTFVDCQEIVQLVHRAITMYNNEQRRRTRRHLVDEL